MTNVVGLQTDDAGNIGQNSSAHVARVVGLQTDAVVVTETHFSWPSDAFEKGVQKSSLGLIEKRWLIREAL